jgi:hypothetical protein
MTDAETVFEAGATRTQEGFEEAGTRSEKGATDAAAKKTVSQGHQEREKAGEVDTAKLQELQCGDLRRLERKEVVMPTLTLKGVEKELQDILTELEKQAGPQLPKAKKSQLAKDIKNVKALLKILPSHCHKVGSYNLGI